MITFKKLSKDKPYQEFKRKYDQAMLQDQAFIEAIAVSSFSPDTNEVDSRFVNLKIIDNKDFIFFTNYQSPKSKQFHHHDQVSVVIFWSKINLQIRIKAKIRKVSKEYSSNYFTSRSNEKNALAISSFQSKEIDSYDSIKTNYNKVIASKDLTICPDYWGGFCFTPYYFEFWEGQKFRLNKRETYKLVDNSWIENILQP